MSSPPELVLPHPKKPASFTSLVLSGGLLLLACSSGEGTPSAPTGSAGSFSSAGNASGAGNSAGANGSSAGTSAGGTSVGSNAAGSNAAGSGQAGTTTAGTGGTPATQGGASGASGSGGTAGGSAGTGGGVAEPFALKSTAFKEAEQVPLKYKCAEVNPKGENISPPLSWGPGPAGTKSYAIVMMHLPNPEHWTIWDIPANVTSLPENVEHAAMPPVPAGSKQSLVDLDGFKGSGYLGPCPQAVNSVQSYRFTLYALDVETVPGLSATSTPTQAAAAVKAHLVAGSQGVSLTGTQIRMP
ncbi:MAG TPA: YbhB/YbcL family Raf kinase inhibitor-like protein [Polyangiaceae bacterium]|nr:YbhB/YbcL family Raf kinase inhibitor-like protein [Polyangiaceae bacterium]